MAEEKQPPGSARGLTRRVDAYARARGIAPKRVRDWISYMVLGGQLENQSALADGPRFTIKGAVAMEMRLPEQGRATKDIDLIVEGARPEETLETLRSALEGEHQGFTFRVKGDPYPMPNDTIRTEVVLEYRGRSWGTIQVDLSPAEGDGTEVEFVEPLDLSPFGLATPDALPCLSLRYQVAQKIHAMTEPPEDDARANERFRDLVDVLLLRELIGGFAQLRDACLEVFQNRGTHEWPPVFDPPDFWGGPFAALAREVDLAVDDLQEAVHEARALLEAIVTAKTDERP